MTVSVVDKPVGTGTVNPLQIKLPAEEVTSTPPGKVSVSTPVCVGFGGNVGRNVKVSPSVVIIAVVDKPVGTGTINPLQIKLPAEEVTSTPPGKVSVSTPVSVGFGGNVGRNVKVSPSVVIIAVVLKPVGTGIANSLQNKVPEEEVTVTPSGKVSVNTPDVGSG